MTGTRDDRRIQLDRHRPAKLELREKVADGRPVVQLNCFAVDMNMHRVRIIGMVETMRTSACNLRPMRLVLAALAVSLAGCSEPVYDASTPQAVIDSLHSMIIDERADQIATLVHIEPRADMIYEDGVTEASAIDDVRTKAGEMLGQLFRVATKLRERYPDEIADEVDEATLRRDSASIGPWIAGFLTNPFGLLEEQKQRLTAEDLGDGTAAILVDGEPTSDLPLRLVEVEGQWRIELPIEMLNEYRPNTRHEWAVVASMMLAIENSLNDFELELDDGKFRNLTHAGERAGRMLAESVVVQGLIYRIMKRNAEEE
jgi:hypothetical protein